MHAFTVLVAAISFTYSTTSTYLQNKILHSQLEALHIQWAEKERSAAGISPGSRGDTFGDAGLQNVVNYLRRSKEIVNTFVLLIFSLSFNCLFICCYLILFIFFNRQKQKFHY
jgi:hypothetical protein